MKKNNIKGKIVVLLLAVVMVLTLAACSDSTKSFLKNGWDHEVDGYYYSSGFGPGVNDEGQLSFYQYSMKGPDAYGNYVDVSGNGPSEYPSYPQTEYDNYWFYYK